MGAEELPYFKFVSLIVDSGLWGKMSPAARALYPVLLRFSDRNFKPVYPGTQVLLKLTGFKQKSTLRKARKELVDLGLIMARPGSGQRRTDYFFRFDFEGQGGAGSPRGGVPTRPAAGQQRIPEGVESDTDGGATGRLPYNQIQISITNHVQKGSGEDIKVDLEPLFRRFGRKNVELAISECELAGLAVNRGNLEKFLYRGRGQKKASWSDISGVLGQKISPGSLEMIENALQEDKDGVLVFSDVLPDYLKELLLKAHSDIYFDPDSKTRREIWRQAE